MKLRLGSMMFLEYFVWGTWYVTVGTWLATALHFSGQQVGWASGSTAVGAMISPFFIGLVADRFFATQRVLAGAHAVGALLLFTASAQQSFVPLYALLLLYALCFMPTLALTSALAMRHLEDARTQFGLIRVFGTLGWIVAGLLVGLLHLEATGVPLRLAAAASLLMALYCLALPDTPPLARRGHATAGRAGAAAGTVGTVAGKRDAAAAGSSAGVLGQLIPGEVLRLLRGRSMAVFVAASFCICIPLQFYYAFTNLFLNQAGWPAAAARMTGGQASETACMLLIPLFFRRLGVKYMLAAGMLAWVLRYLLFAFGDAGAFSWMFWLGVLLHGICFDFFFVVGQIYIDAAAPPALRAATQGFITFVTYGIGMFFGSWLSGVVVDHFLLPGPDHPHNWQSIWLVAAACAGVVLAFFLVAFREPRETVVVPPSSLGATAGEAGT